MKLFKLNLQRLFLLIWLFLSLACAPKTSREEFEKGRTEFGPKNSDTKLEDDLAVKPLSADQIEWPKEVVVADFYEILDLAQQLDPGFRQKTLELEKGFLGQLQGQGDFDLGYARLVTEEAEPLARVEVQETIKRVESELSTFLSQNLPPLELPPVLNPEGDADWLDFSRLIDALEAYLSVFVSAVETNNLDPLLKKELLEELGIEKANVVQLAKNSLAALQNTGTLTALIAMVQEIAKKEGFQLTDAQNQTLSTGLRLGGIFDDIQVPHDGLVALIELWKILTPEQRTQHFKPASQDLYDLFSDYDESDFNCLADRKCGQLKKKFIRINYIYPGIEKYGLEKMKSELNLKTRTAAMTEILKAARTLAQSLPTVVAEKILAAFKKESGRGEELLANFDEEIGQRLQVFIKKQLPNFSQRLRAIPGGKIQIEARDENHRMKWLESSPRPTDFASSLGYWGNTLADLKTYEELDRAKIWTGLQELARFFIRDREKNWPSFWNLNSRDQTRWIGSLSSWAKAHQDWKDSAYNNEFSGWTAQALFPEFQAPTLTKSFVPKEVPLGLSLMGVAYGMREITGKDSKFFLVDTSSRGFWLKDYVFNSESSKELPILVGVAESTSEEKDPQIYSVQADSMSRYILALSEFVEATDNIEKSPSPLLNRKNSEGKSAKDEIIESRDRLKLLFAGMSNFLTNTLKNKNGLISGSVGVTNQFAVVGEPSPDSTLKTQALAIRALLKVYNFTGVNFYKWEAMDLYFQLNKLFYRSEKGLYSLEFGSASKPDLEAALHTALALRDLDSHLEPESREQAKILRSRFEKIISSQKWSF